MALVNGDSGDNTLWGTSLRDTINGVLGNDILLGLDGNDRIMGGRGLDFLVDGQGVDTMFGGLDADIFSLVSDGARDRIQDFVDGEDLIDLSRLGVESFAEVSVSNTASGVMITAGGEQTVVRGASVSDFDEDDFIFADRPSMNFDDLSVDDDFEGSIYVAAGEGDGYFGFSSYRLDLLETDEYAYGNSGYTASSGDNVAFNRAGGTSSIYRDTPFDFESAIMSAAWRDDLNLIVTGYLGDELVGSEFFTLDVNDPQTLEFDDDIFDYVNRVEFTTFGGRINRDTEYNWTQFVMDDLVLVG